MGLTRFIMNLSSDIWFRSPLRVCLSVHASRFVKGMISKMVPKLSMFIPNFHTDLPQQYITISYLQLNYLGDNCIQNFHLGSLYRRIYGWKFSFTVTREQSHKT